MLPENIINYRFGPVIIVLITSNGTDKLKEGDYLTYLGKVYAEDPEYVNKIKKMMGEIDFKKLKY